MLQKGPGYGHGGTQDFPCESGELFYMNWSYKFVNTHEIAYVQKSFLLDNVRDQIGFEFNA